MARPLTRRPCAHCPWRPDRPGFLHPERAEEIAACAADGSSDFWCHQTTEDDDDTGESYATDRSELCAGYLIAAARDGVFGQLARIQARLGMLDVGALEGCDPEHELALDPDEMVEHHTLAWRRATTR